MSALRRSPSLVWSLALCLLACAAPSLRAQERSSPDAYGNKLFIASYPATGFTVEHPSVGWSFDGAYYRFATGSLNPCFVCPVQLPSGIKVIFLVLEACDTSATADVRGFLYSCPTGLACTELTYAQSSGQPGCHNFAGGPTIDVTLDNQDHSYFLRVCNFSADDTTSFRTAKIGYFLQLSPAPATATFADVPTTHLYFRAIEALAKSGITSGCGAGNFCPDQAVTRGEVAKFLANALGLSWFP